MEHPFDGSWGYQVTGYFAPDVALRHAGRLPCVRRPAAPARHRRDPRLGAGALPERRLRRSRTSTARPSTSTPTRAAASTPTGARSIFNYGRNEVRNFLLSNALFWLDEYHVDGLRVDAVASMLYLDYSRKAGEWVPNQYGGRENLEAIAFLQASSTRSSTAASPGVDHRCRGVDRVAGRLAPDLPRRPRLRLQVEHGLDARHAALLPARPGPPPLAPPRADVPLVYAFTRELHPAAVARRGRARQGLAAREDARRRLAEVRQPARAVRATCGRTPARSCCSWAASSRQEQEWNHERTLDWHLLENREHARRPALVRDLNRAYRPSRRCRSVDFDPRGLRLARAQRRRATACSRSPASSKDGERVARLRLQLHAGAARPDYRLGLPRAGPLARGAQHRLEPTAARTWATSAASRPRPCRGTASRSRPS